MDEQRLRNVVRALRESPAPDDFTMSRFLNSWCGTPACAIGHYTLRRDLQHEFTVVRGRVNLGGDTMDDWNPLVQPFDVTSEESTELFGVTGCGNAKTIEQAATYIEGFIERKLAVEEVTAPKQTAVPA